MHWSQHFDNTYKQDAAFMENGIDATRTGKDTSGRAVGCSLRLTIKTPSILWLLRLTLLRFD